MEAGGHSDGLQHTQEGQGRKDSSSSNGGVWRWVWSGLVASDRMGLGGRRLIDHTTAASAVELVFAVHNH
jgi:hypothetical protein